MACYRDAVQLWTLKSSQFGVSSMRLQTCKTRKMYLLKVGKIFNLVSIASSTLIGFLFIFCELDHKYFRVYIILHSKRARKHFCDQDILMYN